MYTWYQRFLNLAAALALTVVVLGAWVRLTDAGLGCPDWPGCYGHLTVPDEAHEHEAAREAFPDKPLDAQKAWHEMIHRYVATTLGLSICAIAGLAFADRRDPKQPVGLPLLLLATVIFQGLLGMWTVTLLVKPLIVVAHLLGGLTTLGLTFWLILEARRQRAFSAPRVQRQGYAPALLALAVLVVQISLGGWTSSNYAALACPDLPGCLGQLWPQEAEFGEAFVLWRGLGINYEGGVLDAAARVAIHLTHRLGALITLVVMIGVAGRVIRRGSQPAAVVTAGWLVIAAVSLQMILGLSTVWFGLPLWVATAHNGGAALLLLSVINLNHAASFRDFRTIGRR
ncbi:MAG: COX15/CtaA family protein [Gammaproteobacteria bacterium]|nr:COX15/CtaA family protein [Gammaproteobacteria bacterium]